MFVRLCAVVETVMLGLWIGALAGFAFVFAPLAFRLMPDLDAFAQLAESTIFTLASLGYVCGVVAVLAALARSWGRPGRKLAYLRAGLIAAAILLSAYDANAVVPQMTAVAASFHAPLESVAKVDPRRQRYDALHAESSQLYAVALLCGLLALALTSIAGMPRAHDHGDEDGRGGAFLT